MATLLADREAGRDRLLAEIGRLETEPTRILAHPALVHRFEAKVGRLRAALNVSVRPRTSCGVAAER